MKFLILHLSDAHFDDGDIELRSRIPQIVATAASLDASPTAILIAITGDVAWSGRDSQYLEAMAFIKQLKEDLREALTRDSKTVSIHVATVPGNHDCDFDGLATARDMLISGLTPTGWPPSADVVSICTSVQTKFFAFRDAVADPPVSPPTGWDNRLAWLQDIPFNGNTIRVISCNTAWLSKLHEDQGHLIFNEMPTVSQDDNTVTIALMHHPYTWLESTSGRSLRTALEAQCDFVFTGHEHETARRIYLHESGGHIGYIEGGVLQEHRNPDRSTFNVVIVDTATASFRSARFEWRRKAYRLVNEHGEPGSVSDWVSFPGIKLRERAQFAMAANARAWLDDPGVALTISGKRSVILQDIFVYPDAREEKVLPDQHGGLVSGPDILAFVLDHQRVFLAGDSQSGKTTLAKVLCSRLYDSGIVPVIVSPATHLRIGEQTFPDLVTEFTKQYSRAAQSDYELLSPARRAVIVDDYHRIGNSPQQRRTLVRELCEHAQIVVLVGDKLLVQLRELLNPADDGDRCPDFRHLRLMPFGYLLRQRFVERWLLLNPHDGLDTTGQAKRIHSITEVLDSVFERNFIPCYPIYMLAILQSIEAGTQVDTRASTHGYFYELLIRLGLARGSARHDQDVTLSWLSQFAYRVLTTGTHVVGENDAREFHEAFEHSRDIRREYSQFVAGLASSGVIVTIDGSIRFRYKYHYYYFAASYIRDHITLPETRARVAALSSELHVEEYATIMLFLAHLTKDPFVFESMVSVAAASFAESPKARLGGDVEFVKQMGLNVEDGVVSQVDLEVSRDDVRAAMDDDEPAEPDLADDAERDAGDILDPIAKLNSALKTIQIVGQVLKSSPGSLEGATKTQGIEACCGLGLRVLGWYLELVREHREEFVKHVVSILKHRVPQSVESALEQRAKDVLARWALIASFGIVKRLSLAIGSPELIRSFRKVYDADPSMAMRLIGVSMQLDRSGAFPKAELIALAKDSSDNVVVTEIARALALEHFALFPVPVGDKQSVLQGLRLTVSAADGREEAKTFKDASIRHRVSRGRRR